jgi:hypothetical protein
MTRPPDSLSPSACFRNICSKSTHFRFKSNLFSITFHAIFRRNSLLFRLRACQMTAFFRPPSLPLPFPPNFTQAHPMSPKLRQRATSAAPSKAFIRGPRSAPVLRPIRFAFFAERMGRRSGVECHSSVSRGSQPINGKTRHKAGFNKIMSHSRSRPRVKTP